MIDKEAKKVLPELNDLHPPGRNGKALVVTSAIVIRAVAQEDWITGQSLALMLEAGIGGLLTVATLA